MKLLQITAFIIAALLIMAAPSYADSRQDARRLGAFSGAMKYCVDIDGAREGRYKMARWRTFNEIDQMSSKRKLDAIFARDHAFNNGRFMGRRLDRRHCSQLLKASEWKRYFR